MVLCQRLDTFQALNLVRPVWGESYSKGYSSNVLSFRNSTNLIDLQFKLLLQMLFNLNINNYS